MTLTVQSLRTLMDRVREMQVDYSFDVYPHPTITEAYEISREALKEVLGPLLPAPRRRLLVVPKDRLDEFVVALKRAGADVRVSPVAPRQQTAIAREQGET